MPCTHRNLLGSIITHLKFATIIIIRTLLSSANIMIPLIMAFYTTAPENNVLLRDSRTYPMESGNSQLGSKVCTSPLENEPYFSIIIIVFN